VVLSFDGCACCGGFVRVIAMRNGVCSKELFVVIGGTVHVSLLIGGLSFEVSQPAAHYNPYRSIVVKLCRVCGHINIDWGRKEVAWKKKKVGYQSGLWHGGYFRRAIFFIPGWNGCDQQSLINRVLTKHWLGVRQVDGFSIDGASTSIG